MEFPLWIQKQLLKWMSVDELLLEERNNRKYYESKYNQCSLLRLTDHATFSNEKDELMDEVDNFKLLVNKLEKNIEKFDNPFETGSEGRTTQGTIARRKQLIDVCITVPSGWKGLLLT